MIDALLYQMTTDMTPFCVFLGHTLGHNSVVYTFRVVTYWHVVSYKLESQYGFDNLLQSHSLARCERTLSLFVFPKEMGTIPTNSPCNSIPNSYLLCHRKNLTQRIFKIGK